MAPRRVQREIGVGERGCRKFLTSVEIGRNFKRVNVLPERRQLKFLDARDFAFRKKDHDLDAVDPVKTVRDRAAGVPRGRDDDDRFAGRLSRKLTKETAEKSGSEVFKRVSGSEKQFERQ